METKFSKGEWWSCCLHAKPHFVFAGEGEKTVCAICSNDKDENGHEPLMEEVTVEEARANARLIQSAPLLLEALSELVFLHGCEQEGLLSGQPTSKQWYDAVEKAESVIKKATE